MLTAKECTEIIAYAPHETMGDDTQVHISRREDGEVVIAFYGSNSAAGWINNFKFYKKAYKHAETTFFAHSGFLKCWKLIRDEIEKRVKDLNPTCITVTGHSYGGALAVLCIEDMRYCFPNLQTQCFTFGAPKVIGLFNWKKIKDRWDTTVQYQNCSDFIPCLPPKIFLYRHVRKLTHLGDRFCIFKIFNTKTWHRLSKYREHLS